MSDLLFDKRCRVQIDDVVINGAEQEKEGLRVAFKVEKTDEPKPNKIELAVYNLAEKTRARLTKTKVTVTLEAGYASGMGLLFKGDVRIITHPREGPDIVTKISSGDGDVALRSARFNENFGPGTKITDVLTKMADKFGVKVDSAKERIRKGDFRGGLQEFANGFTFSGVLQDEFDRQMKSAGLKWSIQNGEMQVLAEHETTQQTAYKIGPGSGLIGSPVRKDKGVVEFDSLLIAELAPGRKVVLESRAINDTLKLKKTTAVGDTWGDDWKVTSEGVHV